MDVAFLPVLAFVSLITLLPLFIVLPTTPPMWDDTRPQPVASPRRAGWRISITVARVDGPKASA